MQGRTGFEGRDSRVSAEGSRGSAPATAASGTEDTATGARGRVCGSGGGGGANATEGCSEGQGFPKGQHRQAERRQGQGEGTQGSGERQARQQHAEDKGTAEAATGESSPEETIRSKRSLQGSGNQDGSRESCAEGCEKSAPQASAGLAEVQSSTREEVVGLPEKAQGQAAEGDNRVQEHTDARDHDGDGHAERHEKLEEEAKSFAQLLEHHGSTQLSIAAGRAEITARAMVEITDKTSYTARRLIVSTRLLLRRRMLQWGSLPGRCRGHPAASLW